MKQYELKSRRTGKINYVSEEDLDKLKKLGMLGRYQITGVEAPKFIKPPFVEKHVKEKKK